MDIDKEEAALRSGIERSALALKSRLEQPLMMKDDSIDSTETGPSSDSCSASACTTQPLGMFSQNKITPIILISKVSVSATVTIDLLSKSLTK